MNLIEGLNLQINRVNEIIKEYESIPGGAGNLTAAVMKENILAAQNSMASGDTIEMMKQYKSLEEWEL